MHFFQFLRTLGHLRFAQVSQVEAAEIQIDRAVALHLDCKEYVSAITLACAAESMLGEHLKARGAEHFTGSVKDLLTQLGATISSKAINDDYINNARNFLKHARGAVDDKYWFDLEHESAMAIVRASINFALLTEKATKGSPRFFQWFREAKREFIAMASDLTV